MYNACIVGTGGIAAAHARAYDDPAVGDRARLVAAYDVDATRAEEFRREFGIDGSADSIDDLLTTYQPDIVHICTPPSLHVAQTIRCLEAGAWVYCEKPLCGSLADLDAIAAAEANGGPYCASVFQFRFSEAAQYLRNEIAAGTFGEPTVSVCHTLWYRDENYYAAPWRGTWESELGGPTVGHGIHAMDLYLYLLGEWREVRASARTVQRNIETEDVSAALVTFENGSVGSIVNSVLSPKQTTYLRFDFTDATVEAEGLYQFSNEHWRFTPKEGTEGLEWRPGPDRAGSHAAQLSVLLDDMADGSRPITSGNGVRPTIEFITALYKSAFEGVPVTRGSIDRSDPFYTSFNGGRDSLA